MSRYIVARRALLDLDEIWNYIAADNHQVARKVILNLRSRFRRLTENQLIGTHEPQFGKEMRSFVVPPYAIFYRNRPDHTLIVRVLHSARDIPNIMTSELPED